MTFRRLETMGIAPDVPLDAIPLDVPQQIGLTSDGPRGRLVWRESPSRSMVPTDQLLPQLLGIRDASGVLAFAKRWGPLRLCDRDRLPMAHAPESFPARGRLIYRCTPAAWPTAEWDLSERVADWLSTADYLRRFLDVAARLHGGRPFTEDDWTSAGLDVVLGRAKLAWGPPGSTLPAQRQRVAAISRALLTIGDVRPGVEWRAAPQLAIVRSGLFGYIAAQTSAAIVGGRSVYVCAGCLRSFIFRPAPGRRRPRTGARPFCETCKRAGRSRKLAQERYQVRSARRTPNGRRRSG